MKKLYFVRHGETVWNVENKICGKTDSPLTERGHAQAEKTARLIRKNMDEGAIRIDTILTSPLSRALDTAKEIAAVTNLPLVIEPRLTEQNFGKWEGTARNGKEFALAKQQFINHYGNGESMFCMAQRIYNLLDDLKQREKIYLLVAHNGISRFIESYFHDMTNEEFASFGIHNGEIKEYEFPG